MTPSGRPSVAAVVAQHFDDAVALRSTRTVLVRAPHVELLHLARLDERLYAHLDGLGIAGDYAYAIARAAIESAGVGELFVLTYFAVQRGDREQLKRLLALVDALPEADRAIASAFGWTSAQTLRGLVAELLSSAEATDRWIGLVACALHRVDPGDVLAAGMSDDNDRLRARALRAAGQLGRIDLLDVCLARLDDADPNCRFQARWASVLLGGGQRSEQALESVVLTPGPFVREALQLLLLRADPDRARDLVRRLAAQGAALRTIIEATGWAGDVQAVPWLIDLMRDERNTRVAGEAFTLLSGADLALLDLERKTPEQAESGPTEDVEDENVELDPDESLPWPNADRVQAWWDEHRSSMPVGTRCFMGAAADEKHCQRVLRTGGQRQRSIAALLLVLSSPGGMLFNIAAPAPRQQRLLGLPRRVL